MSTDVGAWSDQVLPWLRTRLELYGKGGAAEQHSAVTAGMRSAGARKVYTHADPRSVLEVFDAVGGLGLNGEQALSPDQLPQLLNTLSQYSVATDHPFFFNQSFAGADPISVLGDFLGAVMSTTMATYEVAPVFTLIERALLQRLASLAGFDYSADDTPGLMAAGGSMTNLLAVLLARHRAFPHLRDDGVYGARPMHVYTSEEAHYSLRKAVIALGMGERSLVKVPCDAFGAMRIDALNAAIQNSHAQNIVPLMINATAGTTVRGAFDPFESIAEIARRENIWLHIDGAFGASTLFSEREKWRMRGCSQGDSLAWNLHKHAGVTQQCSVLLLKDSSLAKDALGTRADYLFQPDKAHADLDTGDGQLHCGRRNDALKGWLMLKARGEKFLGNRVEHAVDLAEQLRTKIDHSNKRFVQAAATRFTNVCLWWVPESMRSQWSEQSWRDPRVYAELHRLMPAIKRRMQEEGRMLMAYQPLGPRPNCFRWLFINPSVQASDLDEGLSLLDCYGNDVVSADG